MFELMIPALVFAVIFLLVRSSQRGWQQVRLHRQAMALTGHAGAAKPAAGGKILEKAFFGLLPALAAGQVRWVPQPWGSGVEKKLAHVPGWRGRPAAEWLAAKELALLGGILAAGLIGADFLWAASLALAAFFLPDLWLQEQDQTRRRAVLRELPDMLDLLSSCMEAGLGFEPALSVILERGRPGRLRDEFVEMMRMMRMGLSRRDALQAMARRVDEPDFTTLVAALVQAERLGVSISSTLKTQAGQLRTKRSQHVEKLALEAPVKLLFPLVVFIFPVVFVILFGPILIRFMQGF